MKPHSWPCGDHDDPVACAVAADENGSEWWSDLLDITQEEDGSWGVSIRAMPGHVGGGRTLREAALEAHDAALAWIEARRIVVNNEPDPVERTWDEEES